MYSTTIDAYRSTTRKCLNVYIWLLHSYRTSKSQNANRTTSPDSLEGSYSAVGWMVKAVFLTQFLEILHPLVGFTKGGVVEATMQVCCGLTHAREPSCSSSGVPGTGSEQFLAKARYF